MNDQAIEPRLGEKLLKYCTLDDWVNAFNEVYGHLNKDRVIQGVHLHVVEHASEIQEDLRIGRYQEAITHLADAFCWCCAVVHKSADEYGPLDSDYRVSYTHQVLWKFPELCYHCASRQCVCSTEIGPALETKAYKDILQRKNLVRLEKARYNIHEKMTTNLPKLDDLVAIFKFMYSHVNFVTPEAYVVAHFQEEVGEIAECINNLEDERGGIKPKDVDNPDENKWLHELEKELPDVFIWAVALLYKFDYQLGAARKWEDTRKATTREEKLAIRKREQSVDLKLSEELWRRYGNHRTNVGLICPRCGENPCTPGEHPVLGKEELLY